MRVLIAIPVLNEERVLRATVETIRAFTAKLPGHSFTIVIADNGSADGTERISRELAAAHPDVRYLRLSARGKGLAVREAWSAADADAYVFMDADLATDIAALPALLSRIEAGADLAVGSRFHPDSSVRRSAFRRLMSRGYRELLSCAFGTCVADAPCGFKAASPSLVRDVVPAVVDNQWFFDTELVIRAERAGRRIEEVPVTWSEERPAGRRSKVNVFGLVREYLRKVLGLRLALGAAPTNRGGGLRDAVASISPAERKVVAATALAVIALTTVPAVIGAVTAPERGMTWSGRSYLSPGDYGVYLSYIAQVKDGAVLLQNMATTEPLTPVFNVLWLAVGLLARAFDLAPQVAFHASRALLIAPFAAVAYAALAYVFRGVAQRMTGFFLLMFGSGLGALLEPLLVPHMSGTRYEWPIDFWVGESNAFLSMLYTPHFVASWTLIVLSLLLLLAAYDADDVRGGAWAGAAALVLFQFHPFHAPTLYAVGGMALLLRTRMHGFRERQWSAYFAFLGLSAPAVAYHYWLTHWSPNAAFMLHNNVTTTSSPFYVLVGLGAIAVLAVAGFLRDAEEGTMRPAHRQFFAAWAVTQALLVYAPFVFQRRLLQGLQFPLVVLSVPAAMAALRAVTRKSAFRSLQVAFGMLVAVILLPSTALALARHVDANVRNSPPIFHIDADRASAYSWLREMTPKDAVILTGLGEGEAVMGFGERRIFAGHWANTIDLERKSVIIARFFDRSTLEAERAALLDAESVDYVFEGPAERHNGGTLERDPSLAEAFRSGGIVIYRVVR